MAVKINCFLGFILATLILKKLYPSRLFTSDAINKDTSEDKFEQGLRNVSNIVAVVYRHFCTF